MSEKKKAKSPEPFPETLFVREERAGPYERWQLWAYQSLDDVSSSDGTTVAVYVLKDIRTMTVRKKWTTRKARR